MRTPHARGAATPLQALVSRIQRLLAGGDLATALREADRAWRTMPEHAATLAPLLGQVLLHDGQALGAAVRILSRAAELRPTADIEAALIQALLKLGRTDLAQSRLSAALQAYACEPGDPLAEAASNTVAASAAAHGVWACLTADLQLHAERVLPATEATLLELWSSDGRLLSQASLRAGRAPASCRLSIPAIEQVQFVHLTANGQSLPGGDRILPIDFRLDARCSASDRQIQGWARLGWNPAAPVSLEIRDEHGRSRRLRTTAGDGAGTGSFALDADRAGLGDRLQVFARLPDGRLQELVDSPLLFKPALDASLRNLKPSAPGARKPLSRRPAVDIVIPVYDGYDETLACLQSVLATASDQAADIIVVDDASPDAALSAELDALAAQGRIILLRNPVNRGFSGSVNRALALHGHRDAVLVNADAVVFGDWLSRLRKLAYSAERIATVTPFADDDSVASYNDGRVASVSLAAELDAYAASVNRGVSVELPVGVGFCMYIRRQAWREVGELDADTFGKGYGEESDWCMRARKRGWQHRLAADVFVHHAGGRSFGARRQALLERAQRLMNLRHAGYDRYVQRFLKADPLQPLRRNFDAQRLREIRQPIVLIVMLGLTGGVDRFVGERCQRLREQGQSPVLLRPRETSLDACMLWSQELRLPHLRFDIPNELPILRALLKQLPIAAVELHHFLGLDSRLVQLALQLGVPYDAYLHDYSWICPRITLMDHSGQYCGEPDLASCERCVKRNGSDLTEKIGVGALRQRSRRWLRGARRVVTPSRDTAGRFARYLSELAIEVEPLETGVVIGMPPPRSGRGMIRVALLGAIAEHKGYQVLLDCVSDVRARRLPLEFVIIGRTEDDETLFKTGKVFVTGEYADVEVPGLLQRERPDLIWLPSVWPETWCYTLTHALASGLPVVAFDIGAIAERMRAIGVGDLLPMGMEPAKINQQLLEIAARGARTETLFE